MGGWKAFALAGWAVVVVAGVGLMAAHRYTPGEAGPVPSHWAGEPAGRPRLVLFLGPDCPCAAATLRNLSDLLAETGCDATVYVAADSPNGRAAARVAGATVVPDPGGVVARRVGAKTSGHLFAYAADGRLTFHGGITDGRGHDGDNPARRAARTALTGTDPPTAVLPVFGCPLLSAD